MVAYQNLVLTENQVVPGFFLDSQMLRQLPVAEHRGH